MIEADKIAQARAAGYSDGEILDHLSASEPKIKDALAAGYDPHEVLDYLGKAPAAAPAAPAVPEKATYGQALQRGLADIPSGVGKTLKHFGAPGAGAQVEAVGDKMAPAGGQSASRDFMNQGAPWYDFNWSSAPKALVEGAPALGMDLAAAGTAGKLVGKGRAGLIAAGLAGAASYLARNAGQRSEERAQVRTGDAKAEPTTEDKMIGLGTAGAESVLNQVGVGRLLRTVPGGAGRAVSEVVKKAGTEAATNAGQELTSQVGTSVGTPGGLQVDPKSLVGAGLLGGMTGGAFAAPRGLADVGTAFRFRKVDENSGARVAARLEQTAGDGSLHDNKTAGAAMRATETDLHTDLSSALEQAPDAAAAIKTNQDAVRALARIKSRSADQVTDGDLTAIKTAVKDTSAADTVSALTQDINTLRTLRSKGVMDSSGSFKGGMSGYVEDKVRAFHNPVGTALAALGGGAAAMFGTASLPALASLGGVYGGMRLVDKLTGKRSPAENFSRRFHQDGTNPMPPVAQPERPEFRPTGPAVAQQNSLASPMPWGPPTASPTQEAAMAARAQREKERAILADFNSQLAGVKAEARRRANDQRTGDELDRNIRNMVAGEARIRKIKERAAASGDRELAQDAQGLVQSRVANSAPSPMENAQMRDANEQMAARRANSALEADQAEADAPAPAPKAPKPPKEQDPMAAARALVQAMQRVQKMKEKAAPKEQPAPQAEPAPKAAEKFTLPEDEFWHLEHPDAAKAILAKEKAAGTPIRHEGGYVRGTVKRRAETEKALNDIGKELPSAKERREVQPFFSHFFGSRSRTEAIQVREELKARLPDHAAIIDAKLSDEKINSIWKKQ